MADFEVWIYRGAIVVLLVILWYLFKGILKELKLIRGALQSLQLIQTRQDEKLKTANCRIDIHDARLNEHADRIRKVERKQDSCQICKEA